MNQRTIAAIATAYDNAEDGSRLYPAFIRETLAQAETLTGLLVVPVNTTEPYQTSRAMFHDIERGRFHVNAIDPLAPQHPLAARYRVAAWDLTLSANVIFRVVHDVLGHWATGQAFESFLGEQRAYNAHARQYVTADALAVLHSETLGQLAVYHSGKGFLPLQYPKVIA